MRNNSTNIEKSWCANNNYKGDLMLNKNKIKRISIILLIIFLLFLYSLSIIFAFKGNSSATILIVIYSTCFSVILFFLIKLQQYVSKDME
jgi:hypothetical protein